MDFYNLENKSTMPGISKLRKNNYLPRNYHATCLSSAAKYFSFSTSQTRTGRVNMNHVFILTLSFNLALLWPVQGVRVSPKLDFGESSSDKLQNPGIRPVFETRYRKNTAIAKSSYQRDGADSTTLDNLEVVCVSGNCSATNVKTDSDGGISADVLVHIKTNVDVAKHKNDTVEAVPDVPIIVGSKTSTVSTIDSNRPFGIPNAVFSPHISPNVPVINNLGSIPTTNGFIPSARPAFFQNTGLQSDSQTRGFTGVTNYASRFQDNTNVIDFQSNSFALPSNGNVNTGVPAQTWYPKRSGGGGYNPVEFRKTYSNVWTPINWSRTSSTNNDRRTGVGIPRWTPCVCPNQEVPNFPSTQNYPPPNHPAGINGKLGTLV